MPVSISEHIGVAPHSFALTGALDAILDVDSKLFIDPHLLKSTQAPELQNSYEKIQKRFRDVLKLLSYSQSAGDVFWRRANELFSFPEVQGLCIGYSKKSTLGRGMGPQLRIQILTTAKTLVDIGIDDPEIFELIGIFEEKVGADRISDMTAGIILDDLLEYSQRIFSETNAKTLEYPYGDKKYRLCRNPFNNWPIILVPQDILQNLPMASSWDDIDEVSYFNRTLRNKVNSIVQGSWDKKKPSKSDIKHALLEDPNFLKDLIRIYRETPARIYDPANDRTGQIIWHSVSKKYTSDFPLDLPKVTSAEDELEIVLVICRKFKDLIP